MSRGFAIPTFDANDLRRVREREGVSHDEARSVLRHDAIESAIHRAKDLEDIKVCLIATLHYVRTGR